MPNHVLFLEDEPVLGRIYTRYMTEAGFDVSWAQDIPSFHLMIESRPFADIVVLDQSIQDENMDGLGLIPSLKKKIPEALFVMLSNFSSFHLEKRALDAGADAYFVKLSTPPPLLVSNMRKLLLEKHSKQGPAKI